MTKCTQILNTKGAQTKRGARGSGDAAERAATQTHERAEEKPTSKTPSTQIGARTLSRFPHPPPTGDVNGGLIQILPNHLHLCSGNCA